MIPNLRVDDTRNWDMSVTKRIRISEKFSVILSVNTFNLLNQVRFGTPVTSVTSPRFGSVLSASEPRRVEIAAKINF